MSSRSTTRSSARNQHRIERAGFGMEPVGRALEREPVARLLELGRNRVVVIDLEAEMVEARGLAVDLIGVDGKIQVAVGKGDAAVLRAVLDLEPHDIDIK